MARYPRLAAGVLLAVVTAACANAPTTTGGATPPPATAGGESPAPAPEGPYPHLAQARAGDFQGATVEVLAQWVEAEGDNFEAALAPFEEQTGITVNYEGITDYETVLNVRVEGGDAPDLAQLAQPGLMRAFAEGGKLVKLSDWINVDQLRTDFPATIDLATINGDVYGVYYRASVKSIVWYPVQAFEDNGYQVPGTWDELVALSDQIVADGNGSPWCISMEHGDASGWVATDWIEDVLLRTAPPTVYDQWIAHQIPFNAPEVLHAADLVRQIWFTDGYVYGGSTAINGTFVGDTQTPMFDPAGPKCWMHKQAGWIPDFWPKDPATEEPLFQPGVDSAFFYFPPIDDAYGRPALGAGDMFVQFNDRPEVRALLEFLASPEGAEGWIAKGGFVSANQSVPTDLYQDYRDQASAELISESTTLRFDASDTMPAEVGQGTFWSGMVDWVAQDGADTEQVFADIEASWPS